MEGRALLEALIAVAEGAGMRVRVLPRTGEEPSPRSGVCRIRGELWLLLAPGDPVEDQIEAVADALRRYAGAALEGRWLPPAVRRRLEPEG